MTQQYFFLLRALFQEIHFVFSSPVYDSITYMTIGANRSLCTITELYVYHLIQYRNSRRYLYSTISPLYHFSFVTKLFFSGTPSPVECRIGTIRSVVGAASQDDCSPCPPGQYCSEPGRSTPSGDCLEGYYCPDDAKITSPQPTEYQCPAGSSCGNGTADPSPCDAGTYQPNVKETVCLPCEIGHYCPSNSSSPVVCPAGNYCPAESPYPRPCENGFYGNGTGLQAPDDCSPCITGSYCTNGIITGKHKFWIKQAIRGRSYTINLILLIFFNESY